MAAIALNPWNLVCARADWQRLNDHLFPGDGDEHGAVLACGVLDDGATRRLLVREVHLAQDRTDYVPGKAGYRALTTDFIVKHIDACAREKLAYLAVHNHGGSDAVAFSSTDLASHERGYPALLDITEGGPVGALVLARNAVAGDIWERTGRAAVAETIVLGPNRTRIFPQPPRAPAAARAQHHRQTLLFGDVGQALLSQLRIGIVGLGGAGSLICQALVHLGVGELVLVDDDVIDETNLSRIAGSLPTDIGHAKVLVAKRLASWIRPGHVRVRTYKESVTAPDAALALAACDAIFLAADSMQARHVVNAICMQYLVPGFQVGAKVTSTAGGTVSDAYAVSRVLGPLGLCMWCHELILRDQLALEALTPEERRRARYVDEVPAPSVITMNMMASSYALNDFLFSFVGLHGAEGLGPRWYHFLAREPVVEGAPATPHACSECAGRKAFGSRRGLPVAVR